MCISVHISSLLWILCKVLYPQHTTREHTYTTLDINASNILSVCERGGHGVGYREKERGTLKQGIHQMKVRHALFNRTRITLLLYKAAVLPLWWGGFSHVMEVAKVPHGRTRNILCDVCTVGHTCNTETEIRWKCLFKMNLKGKTGNSISGVRSPKTEIILIRPHGGTVKFSYCSVILLWAF